MLSHNLLPTNMCSVDWYRRMTDIQALRHSRLYSNLPLVKSFVVIIVHHCANCHQVTATISDYINYEGYYRYLDIHYDTFNESLYSAETLVFPHCLKWQTTEAQEYRIITNKNTFNNKLTIEIKRLLLTLPTHHDFIPEELCKDLRICQGHLPSLKRLHSHPQMRSTSRLRTRWSSTYSWSLTLNIKFACCINIKMPGPE